MSNRRGNSLCTDPAWQGRADCRHCPIRSQALFAEVADGDLDRLLVPIDNLRYAPKAVIYAAGAPGRHVYTLRRGAVKLMQTLADGTQRVVRVLTTGDVFGLEALLDRTHGHTAVSLHGLDVCRIPIEVVHKLNAGAHPLHTELMRRWQRNLDQADAFITQLSTGTSQARMARLLLLLDGPDGLLQGTPLPREDMGQILGISTETASRIVAEFKRQEIVREDSGLLHFTDAVALQRIAAGA